MQESLEASLIRIHTPDGHVVGKGFLVGGRHILTCAHVVAGALGLADDTPEKPQAPVSLDVPRVALGQLLTAHVVLWRPPLPDGGDDIAGLELLDDPPHGAQAAPLAQVEDLWDHSSGRLSEPLHLVRAIGSGKMETYIVCIVGAHATIIPTREDMLLLSDHPKETKTR